MIDEIGQLKRLWKRVFGDEDAFIDLYFRERHDAEHTHLYKEGNEILAQLQRIPYPFLYRGFCFNMEYVSGVLTSPEHRNKGLMKRLMKEAHRKMYQTGVHIATLIPAEEWLYGYYGNMEYSTIFHCQNEMLTIDGFSAKQTGLPQVALEEIDLDKFLFSPAHHFYEELLKRKKCAVLHTPEDLKIVLSDLSLAKGKIWIGKRDNKIVSVVIAVPSEDRWRILEKLSIDARMDKAMCLSLLQTTGKQALSVSQSGVKKGVPFGMARIINVEEVLRLYALSQPPKEMTISVIGDTDIPENNGYFRIDNGVLKRSAPTSDAVPYTIADLNQLVFEEATPYISLMMN
ncbi:MAG: GNAT family N-acetyltransferase [Prevotellaceae bacterium]|nr:GNAT family N-acetyltransferase [Prevotellaceae bacterium]